MSYFFIPNFFNFNFCVFLGGEIQGLSGQTAISVRLFLSDEKMKNMRTEKEREINNKSDYQMSERGGEEGSGVRYKKEGEGEGENDFNCGNDNGFNEEKVEGREDRNRNKDIHQKNDNSYDANNNINNNDKKSDQKMKSSVRLNQSGRREIPGFGSSSATQSSDYAVPHIGEFRTRNCT